MRSETDQLVFGPRRYLPVLTIYRVLLTTMCSCMVSVMISNFQYEYTVTSAIEQFSGCQSLRSFITPELITLHVPN